MINVDKYMFICSYADLSSVPICNIYASEKLFKISCCLVQIAISALFVTRTFVKTKRSINRQTEQCRLGSIVE